MTRASENPHERPVWPGTAGPSAGTPTRHGPSIRRTSSVDILFPTPGVLQLCGRGRDLATDSLGTATVVAEATARVGVDLKDRTVTDLTVTPAEKGAIAAALLIGTPTGGRFRRALAEAMPEDVRSGSLLGLLLDEVPVATLIAGSSLARRGLIPTSAQEQRRIPLTDVCSGWRAGGLMIRAIEDGDTPFLGEGPAAPDLANPADPIAWHPLDALPVGAMRRRRRLDIRPNQAGSGYVADVLFRDSYQESAALETVVHEYALTATLSEHGTISAVEAIAHALPSPECPAAAASAQRLVGMSLATVRNHVRDTFIGTSTCTHLNDALRSLGDAHALLAALATFG